MILSNTTQWYTQCTLKLRQKIPQLKSVRQKNEKRNLIVQHKPYYFK